jgi:hypothetical protein
MRARVAEMWTPIGATAEGAVTLGRQWFRQPPAGRRNGALRSVCFDASRQEVTGDDLNLNAAAS